MRIQDFHLHFWNLLSLFKIGHVDVDFVAGKTKQRFEVYVFIFLFLFGIWGESGGLLQFWSWLGVLEAGVTAGLLTGLNFRSRAVILFLLFRI